MDSELKLNHSFKQQGGAFMDPWPNFSLQNKRPLNKMIDLNSPSSENDLDPL